MGQRLVRAKARIRDAGIRVDIPAAAALPARVGAVLDAIYAAYGSGWKDVAGGDPLACQDVRRWLRPMIEQAERASAAAD